MSRPAREKTRRLSVLVVAIRSPRPMRAVQRAMLWAITCTASQAQLAAKRPDGMWFSPTPYLRSRIAFSISAWRRWSASSSRVSPSPVGDEAVIAVGGEEGQLGTGAPASPADEDALREAADAARESATPDGAKVVDRVSSLLRNRSKSTRGPEEWRLPNEGYWCN